MFNTTRIEYQVSKIGKLINKLTNSPINVLHRARKYNKKMQNEPNFKNDQMSVSAYNKRGYDVFQLIISPKNEPKRTQYEPNTNPIRIQF